MSVDSTGWKMTSVRWLRQHHRKFGFAMEPSAHTVLQKALEKMAIFSAEEDTGNIAETAGMQFQYANLARAHMLANWSQGTHEQMVEFLEEGGYNDRLQVLSGVLSIDSDEGAPMEPVLVASSPVTTSKPPTRYVNQDLEEAIAEELAAEARSMNPNANSW